MTESTKHYVFVGGGLLAIAVAFVILHRYFGGTNQTQTTNSDLVPSISLPTLGAADSGSNLDLAALIAAATPATSNSPSVVTSDSGGSGGAATSTSAPITQSGTTSSTVPAGSTTTSTTTYSQPSTYDSTYSGPTYNKTAMSPNLN